MLVQRSKPSGAKPRKRGVILLIVVTLLTLLVLIGVTFALVAIRYNQGTIPELRKEEYGDLPEKEFDLVLGQLLYDTAVRSALNGHSILEDLYGSDFILGQVTNITPTGADPNNDNGDQWPQSPLGPPSGQAFAFQFNAAGASQIFDYYTGRVITFTSGAAAGHSSRVLQYDVTNSRLHIETIDTKYAGVVTPGIGDTFIINGAPFNGAGAGFDIQTNNVDAVYGNSLTIGNVMPYPAGDLVALLPHFNGYDPLGGAIYLNGGASAAAANLNQVRLGGLDESWDAADLQTIFLAMQTPNRAEQNKAGNNVVMLPSFHRPELVNYWVAQMLQILNNAGVTTPAQQYQIMAQPYGPDGRRGTADDPTASVPIEQLDRIFNITHGSIFRPMPWDHPNFTGSNPNLAATFDNNTPPNITNAQALFNALAAANIPVWDVDNDGDGLADSIWLDPGLPIVTRPDGTRYKRLVAIMVQDLDGRIDMNAHGNLMQIPPTVHPGLTAQYGGTNKFVGLGDVNYRADQPTPAQFGLSPMGTLMGRGIGFGPAEVDFRNILSNDNLAYGEILTRRYTSNLVGDGFADANNDNYADARPGQAGVRDALNIIKLHGVPNDYANQLSWYASPPDVWGRGAVALDYGGQPITAFMGQGPSLGQPGEMLDNPYELVLLGEQNGTDSPYALVELERLLRYHDPDAQTLPCRPLQNELQLPPANRYLGQNGAGIIGADHTTRQRLAGHGTSINVPEGQIPLGTAGQYPSRQAMSATFSKIPGNATILDFYRAKLMNGLGYTPASLTPAQQQVLDGEFNKIVPWELRHGGKFDINRWLGDGFDSTNPNDAVADDPVEAFADPANPAPFNVLPYNGPREKAFQSPASFAVNAEHVNGTDANLDGRSPASMPPATPLEQATDRLMARQLYARHLFCLGMLFLDSGFMPPCPQEPGMTAAQHRELLIRRLAQWAINVVDFRDSDSIMTPFEYDVNPWNGWEVDGNLGTDGTAMYPELIVLNNTPPAQNHVTTERRVVWGTEQPELLITETFAFHSRNVRDTKHDTTAKGRDEPANEDDDVDQFRVPQGSLYFELFNPRAYTWAGQSANQKPRLPRELYDANGRLQLGKVAPNGWPVWRIAISQLSWNGQNAALPDARKPNVMATSNPESSSFDPADVNLLSSFGGSPVGQVPLDRYVWFTTPANAWAVAADATINPRSFYSNSNAAPVVEPGQYAIVGPRLTTYIGSRDPNQTTVMPAPPAGSLWGGYSPQRLEMNANGLTVYDTTLQNGTATTPAFNTAIRRAYPIVADIDRLTLSPAAMPPTPIQTPNGPWTQMPPWNIGLNITEPLPLSGFYYTEPLPASTPMGGPVDFYDDPDAPANTFLDTPLDNSASRPLGNQNMIATRTYTDVATLYLQRLANPNLSADPVANPYITVDWAAVDATVFAGEEDTTKTVNNSQGMNQDIDPSDPTMNPAVLKWATRQRGFPQTGVAQANPWPPATNDPADNDVQVGAAELYFRRSLDMSRHTLPYVNSTVATPLDSTTGYLGEPANPFPWLTHLDRPFASPLEMLFVPSSSPARLCSEVTPGFQFVVPGGTSIYDPANPLALRSPFGQLLNFFHTSLDPAQSMQLQRLLDYVEVPSPYAGAERWYNPTNFAAAGLYRPPFNKMSRFRDPGRININTIFDPEIWDAAVSHFPGMRSIDGFADKVFRSRQGYGGAGSLLVQNPGMPTFFANPFRPADAADLMPPLLRQTNPVSATFLRPDLDSVPPIGTVPVPLFDRATANAWENTSRNPYFRYQALQKLGNIFTTHSNCFAVWMTVGYFEVEASGTGVNAAHPDGFQLGQEIGADSGEIVRHRSFFIIDRSVPAGFAPGQKLNSDNCVLLRRMIE